MLERSRRPLSDEERRLLEQHRRDAVGPLRFDAKHTFLAGAAGVALGFLWLVLFHWGDRGAPVWPIVGLLALGAAAGFPFDYRRHRKQRMEREAEAAARWDPVIAVGVVEHVVAEASRAVRLDDNEANTAWFLQVAQNQVLCVWDWANEATERVEVDFIPGNPPTALKVAWTGKTLTPSRPRRRFKRREREPEQCEVLSGTLEELEVLLRKEAPARREPEHRGPPTPASRLADAVEALGFYKYIDADQVSEAKAEIANGAHDWFLGAGRAFAADAERLAEGGVKDLLDDMRLALQVEGWDPSNVEESYDAEQGYRVRIGARQYTMWDASEARRSWELTTTRAAGLINQSLTEAGSQERVQVLYGGEDAVFVLLTPTLLEAIASSRVFPAKELPVPA